jgi:hypothetical protein
VIVGHGEMDGLTVTDNIVNIDAAVATAQCFGIGFGSAPSYPEANYFRNATFSRNIVINGGKIGMSVANAPGAIIEDNLLISDIVYGSSPGVSNWPLMGLSLSTSVTRTTPYADDVNSNITIRNNTVWYGPHVLGGAVGIDLGVEGTAGSGYVVANNSVVYSASTAVRGVGCYSFNNIPNTAYAFVNNNHCYSAAGAYWTVKTDVDGQMINDRTRLGLSAWQTYSSGLDSASITGTPNFVNALPTISGDFHPNANPALPLSPLLGKGDSAKAPKYDLTGSTEFSNPPAIGAYK